MQGEDLPPVPRLALSKMVMETMFFTSNTSLPAGSSSCKTQSQSAAAHKAQVQDFSTSETLQFKQASLVTCAILDFAHIRTLSKLQETIWKAGQVLPRSLSTCQDLNPI